MTTAQVFENHSSLGGVISQTWDLFLTGMLYLQKWGKSFASLYQIKESHTFVFISICAASDSGGREFIMKIILRTLALIAWFVFMPTYCLAFNSTPKSLGLVVDDTLTVVGVNLNGPSYVAGIRPGDVITKVSSKGKELTSADFIIDLYKNNSSSYELYFKSKGTSKKAIIGKKKITELVDKSMFLVKGNPDMVFNHLMEALTFSTDLTGLFGIQSYDRDIKIINTEGMITQHQKKISDYVASSGGIGFHSLYAKGNFAVKANGNEMSLVKIQLAYTAEFNTILAGLKKNAYVSSGFLERDIIRNLNLPK